MIERIIETKIPGCYRIQVKKFQDARGLFIKTFHSAEFLKYGLEVDFKEEYYSVSAKNVLRGMHFQKSPADHAKVVYCAAGKVQDVVLDLRKDSPSYGGYDSFDLSANDGQLIYISKGLAHGFLSLEDNSILVYKVSTLYSAEHDSGILWNSFGADWKLNGNLIISDRDKMFKQMDEI